ncbi:hypothetical protein BYT27DRAFT_7088037 [Phlegmacium glaucopus]|nr:hypothetical protein BYT27DRAFT_7088037 [Phlegmacium glaucopus]
MDDAFKLRQKYSRFRILVIGRANAGKTTLLKRVCNTTEEPCIYDEESNNLLEPTSERGCHDIHRPFAFSTNPQFIFHDSPGFEAGDENQLKEVQSFIEKRAKSTNVEDQLHAIWFCFKPDKSRPLLELEQRFFNEQRAGNGLLSAGRLHLSERLTDVNIIPPSSSDCDHKYPPKAHVCMEGMFPMLQTMHKDDGDHQKQVKELTDKTADPLDDLALKILFVSLQQNNLELCIRYAIR